MNLTNFVKINDQVTINIQKTSIVKKGDDASIVFVIEGEEVEAQYESESKRDKAFRILNKITGTMNLTEDIDTQWESKIESVDDALGISDMQTYQTEAPDGGLGEGSPTQEDIIKQMIPDPDDDDWN